MISKKKKMILVIVFGHLIFGLIMGWHIFGSVYINAINTAPIFLFCKIFTIISLLTSLFLVVLSNKMSTIKTVFIYFFIPYFVCQIFYFFFQEYILQINPIRTTLLAPFFYPYVVTFIWALSIFMMSLDFIFSKLNTTSQNT